MRAGSVISVIPQHQTCLGAIFVGNDGCRTVEIMRRSGLSKLAVSRRQERFIREDINGLLCDDTLKPGKPPISAAIMQRVNDLTSADSARETTYWSVRAMAKAAGIGDFSLQPIWRTTGLMTHRMTTFKLSKDPKFAEKFSDIADIYVDPLSHAVVLSIGEKKQILALDRTLLRLRIKTGGAAKMTYQYIRHGTTTLSAAMGVLYRTMIRRNMQRHRHREFIRFLNQVDATVPAGKLVPAIFDQYVIHKHATHKRAEVSAWLARSQRGIFHFTPTSASWLNAVEGFFSALTRRRFKRGVFRSLSDLQAASKC